MEDHDAGSGPERELELRSLHKSSTGRQISMQESKLAHHVVFGPPAQ